MDVRTCTGRSVGCQDIYIKGWSPRYGGLEAVLYYLAWDQLPHIILCKTNFQGQGPTNS